MLEIGLQCGTIANSVARQLEGPDLFLCSDHAVGVIQFGRIDRLGWQFNMCSPAFVAVMDIEADVIRAIKLKRQTFKPTFPACLVSTQQRRISGKTKAHRGTFPPHGHSRSLKAGILSDTKSQKIYVLIEDHADTPAQVKNPQRFASEETGFPPG
ncbi:hypothetical protein ILYODFUR_035004 [Ilyodon furcidens]|uniref:Uncharacterized protein n=1 Tax=Ilyodon furcidens TaxID=33524 RepID=A0ABV0SUT1_9TELE